MTPGPYTEEAVSMRRHPLVSEMARSLAVRCGVPAGSRVVFGVSGGADSVALLVAALALRDREPPVLEPLVVHVNHHLREGADDDAAFVTDLGLRLDVPVEVRDVHPETSRGNLQAEARRVRYEALANAALDMGAGFVAVAHHAADQLETMLMALGRGAGLDGLAGMESRHQLADGVVLVRPFLGVPRDACEDLCREAGIAWRDDPTNDDPTGVRPRLRRDVLPVLEALWPGAAVRASALSELVGCVGPLVARDLDVVFGPPERRTWSREALASLPGPLVGAGLRRAALALEPSVADDLGGVHLRGAAEAIRDGVRRPRRFDWPAGMTLQVTAHVVSLAMRSRPPI